MVSNLLFSINCLGLNHVFELRYHMYADNTQLYVEFPCDQPAHVTTDTDHISRCAANVKSWMDSSFLLRRIVNVFNLLLTQSLMFGCSVTLKPFIRDIGFVFDDTISMVAQIRRVCQVAYCHIRGIATTRKCLSTTACKTIIHALFMSRLDYRNAALRTARDAAAETADG